MSKAKERYIDTSRVEQVDVFKDHVSYLYRLKCSKIHHAWVTKKLNGEMVFHGDDHNKPDLSYECSTKKEKK